MGRIFDQPVPDGTGIAWHKAITLSLTADHRAIDGAPAARFLGTLAGYLSDPAALPAWSWGLAWPRGLAVA